jgi:hypothetical protein
MLEDKGSEQRAAISTRSLASRREFERKDGTRSCGDISDTLRPQAAGRQREQVRVVACEHVNTVTRTAQKDIMPLETTHNFVLYSFLKS